MIEIDFSDDDIERIEKVLGKKVTEEDLRIFAEDAINDFFSDDSDLKEL